MLKRLPRRVRTVAKATVLAGAVLLPSACGTEGSPAVDDAPSTFHTAAFAGTETTVAASPSISDAVIDGVPEAERAMDHVRALAVDIGIRAAGTSRERDAAEYLAGVLAGSGYDTAIEPFTYPSDRDRSTVMLPDGRFLAAQSMRGGPNAEVTGHTVHAGLGASQDFEYSRVRGKVVVFDRGTVTFAEKTRLAVAGGAVAVIIVNNEEGLFRGSLGDMTPSIPVVLVARDERDALMRTLGESITVNADVGAQDATSQNVVARRGEECHAYLGAHYDSVPAGPGANDNASGTAVVLEIARTNPIEGLCVVLFGAEEVGLYGSREYVADHLAGMARFMLNVDMAGRLDGPVVIGNSELTSAILQAVDDRGVAPQLQAGEFPPFASSDHVSFESVGVPAVTVTSGNDEAIHTPQDTIDRIQEEALQTFLDALDAALDALVEEHADALPG